MLLAHRVNLGGFVKRLCEEQELALVCDFRAGKNSGMDRGKKKGKETGGEITECR